MLNDLSIKIAGKGGDGVIFLGDVLAVALKRCGYQVMLVKKYGAAVRGGDAACQLRISRRPVEHEGTRVDVLMAFQAETVKENLRRLKNDGWLVVDDQPESCPDVSGHPGPVCRLPINRLTNTFGIKSKNIISLAFLAYVLSMDLSVIRDAVEQNLTKRGIPLSNLDVFDAAWKEATATVSPAQGLVVGRIDSLDESVLWSGNEAVVFGALVSKCRMVAGYPITPATSTLELFSHILPRLEGFSALVQPEDEMAAIGVVIGMSLTGAKAMTATSGPGFQLMGELLGYACVTETPLVLLNVQRGGPSTGLPTATEQSDLFYTIHGRTGDSRLIVLAPTTVTECFYLTIEAFNLAERFQTPVIILSDQYLGIRKESVSRPDTSSIEVTDRVVDTTTNRRFQLTDSGISPYLALGRSPRFIVTGLCHNEEGRPDTTPENHQRMSMKLERKFQTLTTEIDHRQDFVEYRGDPAADFGIVAWGSSTGAVREAVDRLSDLGRPVAAAFPKILSPLPPQLGDFLKSKKRILVVELNQQGQLAACLRDQYLCPTVGLNRVGESFTPEEVMDRVKEVD
ncbi:MAG: 2-oxoacid:acceptor oxidoreductase subunit alpha [Deltaproteobacteria bacterium]|nr:2-oxoacid:acceptor oxidoreductase subunit alpha [Deltaproteobacteria bacterium]